MTSVIRDHPMRLNTKNKISRERAKLGVYRKKKREKLENLKSKEKMSSLITDVPSM